MSASQPRATLAGARTSRRPRWWFDGSGGRGFVHRPGDALRAGIGLAIIVACSALVHEHMLRSIESSVLLFVNGWPNWLFRPMWAAQFAGVIVVGPVAAAVAAVLRQFRLAAALLAATGLKIWLESVVKTIVHRQRPGELEPDAILRGDVAHTGLSFVSGHAILVTAMAALVSPYLRGWWKAIPWTVAALNLLARLYLGAHFPLDLIGGAGVGLLIGAGLNAVIGVPRQTPSAGRSSAPAPEVSAAPA